MLDMRVEDIRQLYDRSLVLYKNKPVYINDIGNDGDVQFLDLFSQRIRTAAFSMKDFTAPLRRLGFINTMGSVVYASRIPIRRYKVGLSEENVKFDSLGVNYLKGKADTIARLTGLSVPEIGDALFNKYPSLEEAISFVRKFKGAMAFDKQFAVSSEGGLFYKTQLVGSASRGIKRADQLEFRKGFEHLALLLDKGYEKTLSTTR
jgi:hypothetical protein